MIDNDVLRQLGWSDELLVAINRAAGSLRSSPKTEEVSTPIGKIQAISTTVIYSDAVINNTFRAFTVPLHDGAKEVKEPV